MAAINTVNALTSLITLNNTWQDINRSNTGSLYLVGVKANSKSATANISFTDVVKVCVEFGVDVGVANTIINVGLATLDFEDMTSSDALTNMKTAFQLVQGLPAAFHWRVRYIETKDARYSIGDTINNAPIVTDIALKAVTI